MAAPKLHTIETDYVMPLTIKILREARAFEASLAVANDVEGILTYRVAACLYVLARRGGALGNVVEIGSFKGRSTVALARALKDIDSPYRVIAIDPHQGIDEYGRQPTLDEFRRNVEKAGVQDKIDCRVAYSQEVAGTFDEPVGFLWIDGDHSYDGVRFDFDHFFPHVVPGGWVAFHDTMNVWYGPTRLINELLSQRDDITNIGAIESTSYLSKAQPHWTHKLSAHWALARIKALNLYRTWRRRGRPSRWTSGEETLMKEHPA